MRTHSEKSGDEAAVRAVVAAAFGRAGEARLVDDLRGAGDLVVSLVARSGGTISGYCALSRMPAPAGALALAPLAVLPAWQRRGIGTALVRAALTQARDGGWHLVFVLGDPVFYGRFGFAAATAARFPCPYSGPHFMALCLGGDLVGAAPVVYPAAFASLG